LRQQQRNPDTDDDESNKHQDNPIHGGESQEPPFTDPWQADPIGQSPKKSALFGRPSS
jgi:hypothetical protein